MATPRKQREKYRYVLEKQGGGGSTWLADDDAPADFDDVDSAMKWAQANVPGGTTIRIVVVKGVFKIAVEEIKKTVLTRVT